MNDEPTLYKFTEKGEKLIWENAAALGYKSLDCPWVLKAALDQLLHWKNTERAEHPRITIPVSQYRDIQKHDCTIELDDDCYEETDVYTVYHIPTESQRLSIIVSSHIPPVGRLSHDDQQLVPTAAAPQQRMDNSD